MSIETNEIMNNIPNEATDAVENITNAVAGTGEIPMGKIIADLGLAAAGTIAAWELAVKPAGKKIFAGGKKLFTALNAKWNEKKHANVVEEKVEYDLETNPDEVPKIEK